MKNLKTIAIAIAATAAVAVASLGCHEPKPPMVPDAPRTAVALPPVPVADAVVLAPQVAATCGIETTREAPKFGYDSAELRDHGRDVLDTLARCMMSGALEGRKVVLTGHTDPRGSDEYNFTLATYRSQAVGRYLEARGVAPQRLVSASRGEMDAVGTDEASWALDRRVEIDLVPSS